MMLGTGLNPVSSAGADGVDDDDDDDDDDGTDDGDDRGDDGDDDDDDDGDGDGDDDGDGDQGATTDGSDEGDPDTAGTDDGVTVIYFNATGAALKPGVDNAPLLQAETIAGNQTVAAHTNPLRAEQLMAVLQGIVADYPIEVVSDEPPAGTEYTMVMVTAAGSQSAGFETGLLSIGLADCGNLNPNNVVFVFDDPALGISVNAVANTIAFSVGSALGLNANATEGDAMSTTLSNSVSSFTDVCVPVPSEQCAPAPAGACPAGEQNSHAAMVAAFP